MSKGKRIIFYSIVFFTFVFVVTLIAAPARADTGSFYVYGAHYDSQVYGSRGEQVTHSVSVIQEKEGGCASFVSLYFNYYNWAATGFYQGWDYENNQFYNYPRYYYDYKINGSYHFHDLGVASLNQYHNYSVHIIPQQPYPNKGIVEISIDGSSKAYLYDYTYTGGEALGESESHNSQNTMNYHFWNMEYANSTGYWYPFQATKFHYDSPYSIDIRSVTEWYTYVGGQ